MWSALVRLFSASQSTTGEQHECKHVSRGGDVSACVCMFRSVCAREQRMMRRCAGLASARTRKRIEWCGEQAKVRFMEFFGLCLRACKLYKNLITNIDLDILTLREKLCYLLSRSPSLFLSSERVFVFLFLFFFLLFFGCSNFFFFDFFCCCWSVANNIYQMYARLIVCACVCACLLRIFFSRCVCVCVSRVTHWNDGKLRRMEQNFCVG